MFVDILITNLILKNTFRTMFYNTESFLRLEVSLLRWRGFSIIISHCTDHIYLTTKRTMDWKTRMKISKSTKMFSSYLNFQNGMLCTLTMVVEMS